MWADGRPAPPLKGQLRRRQEREVLAVSVTHLSIPQESPSQSVVFCKLTYTHSLSLSLPQRRIVMLDSEVDRGIEAWREREDEAKRLEEHKKSLLLKPKGKQLIKKKSQS